MTKYVDFEDTNVVWYLDVSKENMEYVKTSIKSMTSGDTDSAMYTTKALEDVYPDLTIDDVIELSDTIADQVNDTFPDFVTRAFNCPASRKHTVTTGREVVFDKALFLSKKRYIMHVVNDEGKTVDKLKIMGVEIKKSDTPPIVIEFLTELVDMILNGDEYEHVMKQISKMKTRFFEADYMQIARPIGCKQLKKYSDSYDMDGSMKGFPYQVKAAMHYNLLKTQVDREIKAGDRVLFCYVKHIDTTGICIPDDLNVVPDFVKDIPIDYEKQWATVKKKLTNYLSSLRWDTKTKLSDARDELMGFNK